MRAEVVDFPRGEEQVRPPVRIRTVLAALLVGIAGYTIYPRAEAAWQLHGLAAAVADYALCAAGPTGPSLIRDNPDQFAKLVRRRLVTAAADDRPFADCAELARTVTASDAVYEAHSARATEFREYEAWGSATRSLAEVRVTSDRLAEVSRRAWPFVRGGYTRLVKPSLSATEAVHPVSPAEPGVGSGLPNWRARYRAVRRTQTGFVMAHGQGANLGVYETRDEGLSWRPIAAHHQPSNFQERCPIDADGRSFTFSTTDDETATVVNSLGPDGAPYATVLAPAHEQIFAAACDAEAVVIALASMGGQGTKLYECPFRRSCAPMRVPAAGMVPTQLSDVARVAGTTVIAVSNGEIVRVASSRDSGRSWTPWSVAFDAGEHQASAMGLPPPARLLGLDDRLILYGGAERSDQAYLVLVSEDQGASWKSPL
ncbi:MAG TPA: hypothetical protein VI197_00040 [Polyangiaceae bacterium]